MTDSYNDVQRSLGQCLRQQGFITRFYDIFLASHPEVRIMFERTDFGRQRKALRRGISVAVSHAGGSGIVKDSMDKMAEVHSRSGRAPVHPDLYPYWVDSLVETVKEFDPSVDARLEARWREAMEVATAYFAERY